MPITKKAWTPEQFAQTWTRHARRAVDEVAVNRPGHISAYESFAIRDLEADTPEGKVRCAVADNAVRAFMEVTTGILPKDQFVDRLHADVLAAAQEAADEQGLLTPSCIDLLPENLRADFALLSGLEPRREDLPYYLAQKLGVRPLEAPFMEALSVWEVLWPERVEEVPLKSLPAPAANTLGLELARLRGAALRMPDADFSARIFKVLDEDGSVAGFVLQCETHDRKAGGFVGDLLAVTASGKPVWETSDQD